MLKLHFCLTHNPDPDPQEADADPHHYFINITFIFNYFSQSSVNEIKKLPPSKRKKKEKHTCYRFDLVIYIIIIISKHSNN